METPVELSVLSELQDYRVCAPDTDPRGWQIIDSNHVAVGVVSDLIIDVAGLVARYIVCDLQRAAAKRVLVPIGFVRLDDQNQTVVLDFITRADLDDLPGFTGLPLSEADNARMGEVLTGSTADPKPHPKIIRRSS